MLEPLGVSLESRNCCKSEASVYLLSSFLFLLLSPILPLFFLPLSLSLSLFLFPPSCLLCGKLLPPLPSSLLSSYLLVGTRREKQKGKNTNGRENERRRDERGLLLNSLAFPSLSLPPFEKESTDSRREKRTEEKERRQ